MLIYLGLVWRRLLEVGRCRSAQPKLVWDYPKNQQIMSFEKMKKLLFSRQIKN